MTIGRVLVAFKKSAYQLYVQERGDNSLEQAIESKDPVALELRQAHELQDRARIKVEQVLEEFGIRFDSRWRGRVRSINGRDMVVAVGGDGTLLDVARYIDSEVPLFGVNSDPSRSVGMLCACTAGAFAQRLQQFIRGELKATPHARLRVRVDGTEVLGPCLNDILFAHRTPADMSRFQMAVVPREHAEEIAAADALPWNEIRGSGIWIATATGSTAAIRSAGGKVQAPRSRRIQYMVREPYTAPDVESETAPHGFLTPDQALVMVSRMQAAKVWADGPHRKVVVRYGQRITVDLHPQPLMLVRTDYRT